MVVEDLLPESKRRPAPYAVLLGALNSEARRDLTPGMELDEDIREALLSVPFGIAQLFAFAFGAAHASMAPGLRRIQHRYNINYPEEVPGPSDLVRMELREVFRPDDRAAQLTPPPSAAFLAWMAHHGFSRYHAESYWAAHWDLPSLLQGYEMLHRLRPGRVPQDLTFDEADMRALLRKQDVLPLYHDRLMAISRSAVTRVDVRRLRRLGVIDRAEVEQRYLDLGYSDKDAALLADFTERDVEPQERALTVSLLTEAYVEGIMDRAEVEERLSRHGYGGDDLADLLDVLDRRVMERALREAARRERSLKSLRGKARRDLEKGELDREEYDDQLNELGLTAEEQASFWASITPPRVVRDLSVGQVLKLLRAGEVDEAAASDRLARLGYKREDADALVRAELVRRKDRTRELTTAQVLRLYRDGLLDGPGAHVRLIALGYDREDAELLLVAEALRLGAAQA